MLGGYDPLIFQRLIIGAKLIGSLRRILTRFLCFYHGNGGKHRFYQRLGGISQLQG